MNKLNGAPVFVDFLGPSGAGKTSTSMELVNILRGNGFVVFDRRSFLDMSKLERKIRPFVNFLKIKNLTNLFSLIRFRYIKELKFKEISQVWVIIKHLLIVKFLIENKKVDFVVYDESFIKHIQGFDSLILRSELSKRFLEIINISSVHILIELSGEVCLERCLSDKKKSKCFRDFLWSFSNDEILKMNKEYQRKNYEALTFLNNGINSFTLKINGDDDLDFNARKIFKFLEIKGFFVQH